MKAKPSVEPSRAYLEIMQVIRRRLDIIATLKASGPDDFLLAETSAFHARKIVEAISFACLIAIENGLNYLPKNAKGKWNAEDILKELKSKGLTVLPSPSSIRETTQEEFRTKGGAKAVVQGLPLQRLTHDELIAIYQRLHSWLHEINPYTARDRVSFHRDNSDLLWKDVHKLERFIERHFISIKGLGFFCVLRDSQDGQTKVMSIAKIS